MNNSARDNANENDERNTNVTSQLYRVVIEEEIIERRVYLCEAVTPKDAAEQALSAWLVGGDDGAQAPSIQVEERTVTVMSPDKSMELTGQYIGTTTAHKVYGVFSDGDLLSADEG